MTSKSTVIRLLEKIQIAQLGYISPCWIWTASKNPRGYGSIYFGGRTRHAHIVSYLLFIGEIPIGYEIDHLCHSSSSECSGGSQCPHRSCVNPDHLEAVTKSENWKRGSSPTRVNSLKQVCKNGHPFTNVSYRKSGRFCLQCNADRASRNRLRAKAENAVAEASS